VLWAKPVRAPDTLTSPVDTTAGTEAPARIRVVVIDGPDRGAVHDASGVKVAIGTAPDNEVVLTDPTVSHYHVELSSGDGLTLRDLGSRNGTFVNDVRIRKVILPLGSCVRLGTSVIRLLDRGPVVAAPEAPAPQIPGLVAVSTAMQDICRTIRRLAHSNVSVLVQGETGTGKELVARAIHESSCRASGPFLAVDCGALAPTLIASQLFGHERGAFTGADSRCEGAFELAKGGSIFLDEIGELQIMIQPALLGVLERRAFRRLGGRVDVPTDVRVIAATNRDLRAEVNQGTFRSDLYFRLAVARIQIPPLRERTDDIEALIKAFSMEITGRPEPPFSYAAVEALRSHRWSGNIRELRNVVESALALGNVLPHTTDDQDVASRSGMMSYQRVRTEVIAAFEHGYLRRLIEQTGGNVAAAARTANMGRTHLISLLKKHGLGRSRMGEQVNDRAGFLAALPESDPERKLAENHAHACSQCREAFGETPADVGAVDGGALRDGSPALSSEDSDAAKNGG